MAAVTTHPVVAAQVGVWVGGWEEAVYAACAPLIAEGAVEERYATRCVEMVREHGPYIVLAPGIALAHARPEDGVLRLCLAATTLERAVPFGHDENDPVDLVFAFGSPDDRQHVGLLGALARSLGDGLADDLRAADDAVAAKVRLEEVLAGG